jgi:hypothetical protein
LKSSGIFGRQYRKRIVTIFFLRFLLASGVLSAHCSPMTYRRPVNVTMVKRTHLLRLVIGLAILASFGAGPAFGQNLVRVPADTSSVQDALALVADGGTVEIASGTYTAPNGGFTNPPNKAITIQAAPGASVTLSGGGSHDIFRFTNAKRSQGKPITFVGLRFSDGVSNNNFIGGAFTIGEAEAAFKGCAFLNNNSTGIGGGGAFFVAGSVVSFEGCVFIGNVSSRGGGGISASDSRVYVTGGRFTGNRCNLPGHSPDSPGGGIYSFNTELTISGVVFDENQAGYVGGAVYDAAPWDVSEKLVEIKNCLFVNNRALPAPGVTFGAPALGGAVHVEENITLNISNCNFIENVSSQAGAISTYRSVANVDHCFFRGNRALPTGTNGEGTGGAIMALSADGPGEPNRRPITLNVFDCLFLGADNGLPDAKQGGQIFAGGDRNAAYGLNGAPQNGTVDSNRGKLNLRRVTFYKSRVDSSNSVPARGSGVVGDFAHIEADNVLFLEGDAGSGWSALAALSDSVAHLRHCVFQRNSARSTPTESFGAAVTQFGGELQISNTHFLDNFYTPQNTGKGIDIVTSPDAGGSGGAGTDMTGLVTNCIFSGTTTGGRIYDGAGTDKRPFNLLQYSLNTFMTPGTEAYISDILSKTDVTGLNNFVVQFNDGSTVDKAPVENVVVRELPAAGQILNYLIKAPLAGDAGGTITSKNFIGFSATMDCSIDGVARGTHGVIESNPGPHTLTVGFQTFSVLPEKNVAANIATRLQVGTGTEVLIGGFIIQGNLPKRVAVRGIGPSLSTVGVAGALADPVIELRNQSGGLVAQNDNWFGSDQRVDLIGVGLAPAHPNEAALIAALNPGAYTVVLGGVGGTSGVGLVEIYDLDGSKASSLANIATRGKVAGGDQVMIGGFIMLGDNGATNVVVRAIGPSLSALGVNGALSDPVLEVYDGNGRLISQNDDWGSGQDAIFVQTYSLAPGDARESALLLQNPAQGNYTAILKGKNGGIGVGIVEAYIF